MERFVEFEQDVSMDELQHALTQHNPGVMILRRSKLTGAVKIRIEKNLTKKEIKRAFMPYKVKKIYSDFRL